MCCWQQAASVTADCAAVLLLACVCVPAPVQAFGWRSMFVLLATISALVILPLLLWCVPETLQYKVMQSLAKQQPDKAKKIAEAQDILGQVGVAQCCLPRWPLPTRGLQ